jgi:hypothetical protein
VRLGDLLDAHFGTGAINLVRNNPFPLYEGAGRKVYLGFGKPAGQPLLMPDSGHAHIQPFVNCPAADYPYSVYGWRVTQAITATTLGIGLPAFQWRVNGKPLWNSSGRGLSVSAQVDAPDPQHPDRPQRRTETFDFDYEIKSAGDAMSSTLTLTSASMGGDTLLEVEAEADEKAAPTGVVSAKQGLTLRTRTIEYGGSYSADRERCVQAFEGAIADRVRVHQYLNLLRTLPDPPPPGYLPGILEAAAEIRGEIARLAATDPTMASQVAHYAAMVTGVPANVFLKQSAAD